MIETPAYLSTKLMIGDSTAAKFDILCDVLLYCSNQDEVASISTDD